MTELKYYQKENKPSNTTEPLLVKAQHIAKRISCSVRYVHILHEEKRIPGYRFGKNCIRFNEAAVMEALGVSQ